MGKILLIDDDKAFNQSLKEYLEYEGYEVSSAFDGKQGIEMIYREKPELVITDIIMPDSDGIEVLKQLNLTSTGNNTKVIAISGGGRINGKEYLNIAKQFNADYVFEKPLDINALVEAINELLSVNVKDG